MILRQYVAVLSLVMIAGACKQKSEVVPDTAVVSIEVTSPVEGQIFHAGDTVWLKASAQYATQLHGYELQIRDSAGSNVLFDIDEHVHSDHFDISDYWVDTLSAPAWLVAEIVVEVNHEGKEARKTVSFQSQ